MALIALVPKYAGNSFGDAPPGHRYRLYLQFWNGDGDYSPTKKGKLQALHPVCKLPEHSKKLMKALACRSQTADTDTTLCIEANSTAPFATGLGWEHPNENGFAFLDPYGLPYLPGSGIKGVLRQAARDLGWSEDAVACLFGSEDASNPCQGALRFWDVIPELAGGKLEVDILNPHYRDYYQQGGTPHDAGQPVPVFFLTVPPNSKFHFRVDVIAPGRLGEELRRDWKNLLNAAFEHAFDWLGFGAKTAVGYGAMARDQAAEAEKTAKAAELEEKSKQDAMSEEQKAIAGLRQQYQKEKGGSGNSGINGPLYQKLRETILGAASWPVEAKRELAVFADEIVEFLGVKKNQKAKELLRRLST